MRRYEAYPTIKTRAGLPGLPGPRIAVFAGAVAIAALALFMLPALLGIGSGGPSESRGPSQPVSTPSATPTPVAVPTAEIYVIKTGDTLSKVAKRFGVTLEQILAANPDIKNADKIALGQQIIIPTPAAEATPAASASAAP
jgi:nucleoid-associated protein YgaU